MAGYGLICFSERSIYFYNVKIIFILHYRHNYKLKNKL